MELVLNRYFPIDSSLNMGGHLPTVRPSFAKKKSWILRCLIPFRLISNSLIRLISSSICNGFIHFPYSAWKNIVDYIRNAFFGYNTVRDILF